MKPFLIVSDGRKGHENQSIALAKYLNRPYEMVTVRPAFIGSKSLGYVGDRLNLYFKNFITNVEIPEHHYGAIVGTGSSTYYAVKYLAKEHGVRSVTMMLPKGYRYDLDVIFAQTHDHPPKQKNIIEVPANFAYVEPQGIYQPKKQAIGIVIGGENGVFRFDLQKLRTQLERISTLYDGYEIAITTSPRTSRDVEALVSTFGFDYEVCYGQDPINPIPDLLAHCERVFITADSTSMISEAVSFGKAHVEILPLVSTKENKFDRFIDQLEKEGYLHRFDGTIKEANRKIDFRKYLEGVTL